MSKQIEKMIVTRDEFKEKLMDEFFPWASNTDRPESSWWLTLEDFSSVMYNQAYEKEKITGG